jgi:site-specific recombinase XerD
MLKSQRYRESVESPFVFVSERGTPFTTAGLARMIERAAKPAKIELKAHPHMLRHSCGYALAAKGHDTRAIQGLAIARLRRRWFIPRCRQPASKISGGTDGAA